MLLKEFDNLELPFDFGLRFFNFNMEQVNYPTEIFAIDFTFLHNIYVRLPNGYPYEKPIVVFRDKNYYLHKDDYLLVGADIKILIFDWKPEFHVSQLILIIYSLLIERNPSY